MWKLNICTRLLTTMCCFIFSEGRMIFNSLNKQLAPCTHLFVCVCLYKCIYNLTSYTTQCFVALFLSYVFSYTYMNYCVNPIFSFFFLFHLCLKIPFHNKGIRWVEQLDPNGVELWISLTLLWSRWDKENTLSPGSLVLWLLLAWPIHLPVVTLASGFLPILLPSCPPSKHWFIHSFPLSHSHSVFLSFCLSSLSSTLLFPIWPPGRCVALEQALLIEHLFRHGAGSVACGRAAGGSSRGDIMSYYISWDVLFTCMHAHFTSTHSHRR